MGRCARALARAPEALAMGLQQDVIGILTDQHSRSMDFHIAGLHVNGAGLELVANHIQSGRIALCSSNNLSTAGRYRFARDELQVRSDLSDDLEDSNTRSLIVHEAVHALTDIRRVTRMTNLQSEAAGFIAQALYRLKHRNGQPWRSRIPIFTASLAVVTAKDLANQRGVTVEWDDYPALRTAIQQHPNYKDDDHDAALTGLGIRQYNGARCAL
jgi:hypothetical protein